MDHKYQGGKYSHMPRKGNQGGSQKRDSQGQFTSGQGGQSGRSSSGGNSSRSEAARKGGEAVSRDREHMAEIGRKGGQN
jgi:hypothetical protein